MGFLATDHKFRTWLKNQFDENIESRGPPKVIGPADWLQKYEYAEQKIREHLLFQDPSIQER